MRNSAGALVILVRLCFSSSCITPVSLALYARCKCLVLKVTHWSGRKTWKLCQFLSSKDVKRTISRDLSKIFEFYKMFWIANNACDIVNWKNYLYLSYCSYQGSRTMMLFAGNCLRGAHLTFENVNWINLT